MTTREFYESIGASYDSVLVRFGSEKMITKFAKRFADDTTFQDMCKALEEKNAKEAFRMAHTLKGICSNLGFDELYKASYDLTEDLRDGELSGYEQDYEKLNGAGRLEALDFDFFLLRNTEQYTEEMGLEIQVERGEAVFF